MNEDAQRDAATPAEARLVGYLDDLRDDPPSPGAALVPAVLRSARWQGAVRPYVLTVGRLFGAFGAGLRVFTKGSRSR
jgi:hypothetical protein